MKGHEEAERVIAALFLGGPKRRRRRAKPNRCLGCGKVTRHIFCPATLDACRALYRQRTERT